MKKNYISLFFCLALISANAQWNNNTSQNLAVAKVNSSDIQTANTNDGRTWIAFYSQRGANYDMRAQLLDANGNRMFGDSGILVSNKKSGTATYVFNVCVDANNNFIIAFQLESGLGYECVIQKINTAGKLLWGADLGPGLSPYPVALTTGEVAVAWNNNGKIDYQKLSPSGIAEWQPYKEFVGTNNHGVSRGQLVANTNGGFSIVYQEQVSPPFYTNLYERRFDNSGSPVWSKPVQLSNITTASYRYFDVNIERDTTYVGYYGNPSGKNRFDAYVQRINPDGTLPWGINGSAFADYSADADPYEETIYIAKTGNSTDLWAVCTIGNSIQSASGVSVQKFNSINGARYLGNNAKTVAPISSNLTSLAFARLSLCGNEPIFLITDNSNKLAVTKLNSNGDFAWGSGIKIIGSSTSSKFRYGFTEVYKGQAVAVWQENKGSGDMPYAQNILCNGSTGTAASVITDLANNISIQIKKVYPNPVQDALHANIAAATASTVHIYITDLSGNVLKVLQQNAMKGENIMKIDVHDLNRGTYFMKVTAENNNNAALLFQKK